MIARYVSKSFRRHKLRTAILVLALMVVTMMLVSLNNGVESLQRQVVEFVEREEGEHDITITRAETSPAQFINVEHISGIAYAADPAVVAVYPRFQATVELHGNRKVNVILLARAPEDDLGHVTVLEGAYDLADDRIIVLKVTADTFGLKVGDEVKLSYIMPLARVKGHDRPANPSISRVTRRFTVSGIALATGLGGAERNGILASVETVQEWLGLPGQAERLVVVLDKAVYNSLNIQHSIFRVRRIAEKMYDALGNEAETYRFALDKPQALDWSDVAFAVLRSLSAVYGFLVMGVVGLLVYSIVNTNVEERQRDLAFLRVLGAKRRHLFGLVMIEVALVGLMGVGLGVLLGQALSLWAVAPIAGYFINQLGASYSNPGVTEVGIQFRMTVTLIAVVQAALIAAVVLTLAAIAPARRAANTKMRYAINPGSAEQLQIEDLARLRSRRFDVRIVIAGIVLTIMWLLIFIGNNFLYVQNNEAVIGTFMFGGMALLVIGVSLLFYALTIPFERLLIMLGRVLVPKLTFFAGPNLLRAKRRNTIISLMIVFSATLPTFLGTMAALEQRNHDITARYSNGAPVVIRVSSWRWYVPAQGNQGQDNLKPAFLRELEAVDGIARAVGLTAEYTAELTNKVELRKAAVQTQGLTGSLDGIVYPDLTDYYAGGPEMFERLLAEPDTVILSAGYADYMDLQVGDVVRAPGAGKDHIVELRVIGLIERMPGFMGFSRNERYVRWGLSPAFVSLDTYLRLTHDPAAGEICADGFCSLMEREQPVITHILATTTGSAEETTLVSRLRDLLADRYNVWVSSTAEEIRITEQSMRTMRVLLLIMTVLSFITSIFGVFAVVYVAVYVRRLEIGMLKAIGMRRRNLTGIFALEAVMMTLSASLAGVTAGTVLGYVFYISNNMMRNTPTRLTFDWPTTLAIMAMVILASVISASLAARGIVRSKVTQILREAT